VLLLLLYVSIALVVSFICSMSEAVLLSVRLATLSEQRSQGNRGAGHLLELKRNRIDDAISTILILNTSANTLGATLAGAQATAVFQEVGIGVFSAFITLVILVAAEIVPKTLGAVYCRSLAGPVGWVLLGLTRLLAPALVLSGLLTRALTRGRHIPFSRGELGAVIATAAREGALSHSESRQLANLLRINDIRVQDVMTPRTVCFMMPALATADDLLSEPRADAFSRIPLWRGDPDNVVGYVLQRDVMKAVAVGGERGRPLASFMREIRFVPELSRVGTALQEFLKHRDPIAMVADEYGGLVGLVTLEDLTETLLGQEIVDESDRVVDLRHAALELRDRRLDRKQPKAPAAPVQPEPPR
jgi:CBS domain containing-hemolysin-like protein